jgi:hypothetical protein
VKKPAKGAERHTSSGKQRQRKEGSEARSRRHPLQVVAQRKRVTTDNVLHLEEDLKDHVVRDGDCHGHGHGRRLLLLSLIYMGLLARRNN